MEIDVGQGMILGDPEHTLGSILRSHDFMAHHCRVRFISGGKPIRLLGTVSMLVENHKYNGALASFTVLFDLLDCGVVSEGKYVIDRKLGSVHFSRKRGGDWVESDWLKSGPEPWVLIEEIYRGE